MTGKIGGIMKKGIILSFITALISGISVFANGRFVTQADPVAFAFLRNLLVMVLLSTVFLFGRKLEPLRKLTRADWSKLGLIGLVGGGLPFALFFTGLSQTGAVNGNLINKSLFLWVAILAVPFLKEKLNWLSIVGYGLIFYATYAVGKPLSVSPSFSIGLVLTATVLWSIEYVIAKKTLKTVPVWILAWARMLFGLPFLFATLLISHKLNQIIPVITMSQTALWVSAGLLTVYMISWYWALAKAPATIVTSILVIAPVVTLILTSISKGQTIISTQLPVYGLTLLGISCVCSAKYLIRRRAQQTV
jgi:drug/metabolite transporter (DMT)-like permease